MALKDVITSLGLTSGLKLCLDAGDANSYSSGQSWLDTSGNGYDFFLGATGSAEASDPTFNGTAGRQSSTEYWSFDGGDYFTYHTTNEMWMNNLHKDNAKFTLFAAIYNVHVTATVAPIFGTVGNSYGAGIIWALDPTTEPLRFTSYNTGALVLYNQSALTLPENQWSIVALSLDEAVGANGGIHFLNGTVGLFTSTYTSPSANPADDVSRICCSVGTTYPTQSGIRLGMFAAWEGVALTQAQLNALYLETLPRFGPGHIVVPSPRMQAIQRAAVR